MRVCSIYTGMVSEEDMYLALCRLIWKVHLRLSNLATLGRRVLHCIALCVFVLLFPSSPLKLKAELELLLSFIRIKVTQFSFYSSSKVIYHYGNYCRVHIDKRPNNNNTQTLPKRSRANKNVSNCLWQNKCEFVCVRAFEFICWLVQFELVNGN